MCTLKSLIVSLALSGAAFGADPQWVKTRGLVRFVVEGPIDDVVGETRQSAGVLTFSPEGWAKGSGAIAVDLTTIRTGIDQRDRDMRVEFLETSRYPRAVLVIDNVTKPSATTLAAGETVTGEANGSFELHGVRRSVKVPVSLKMDGEGRVRINGRFDVPFADYNIQRPQRLFLKLGDTASVNFDMGFERRVEAPAVAEVPEPAPAPAPAQEGKAAPAPAPKPKAKARAQAPAEIITPTVATVQPAPKTKAKPKPPRKAKTPLVFTYFFSGDDAKARGERLFHSERTGGEGNKMTCFHCHAKSDERDGLLLKDNHIRAANTMYNAGQRPQFWNGFAKTIGKASDICQKQFMLGDGLTSDQKDDLSAFITAISPDSAPELDYRTNYRSQEATLKDPTAGDAKKGEALAERYCMTCHLDGRVGPVWAPGLYEADWVVRRVRRLEGHQNKQMPPWTIARLPDSDLRDIVTYLTSPASAPPVFDRSASASK